MRLLGVFVVAVAAALFLKILPPLIVLVFFVGGVTTVNSALRSRVRRERREGSDAPAGLRHETGDPFGLLGYPFALFGRGAEGRIGEVAWGTWTGLEIKMFEYSWRPPTGGERTRFSCAMAPLEATCPPLVVEPKMFSALLPAGAGMEAVVLGSDRFDGGFDVRCDDPSFARTLLGERIAEWLEGLDGTWGFEVSGALALAYGPPILRRLDVLERLKAFIDLVPSAIRSEDATANVQRRPDGEAR